MGYCTDAKIYCCRHVNFAAIALFTTVHCMRMFSLVTRQMIFYQSACQNPLSSNAMLVIYIYIYEPLQATKNSRLLAVALLSPAATAATDPLNVEVWTVKMNSSPTAIAVSFANVTMHLWHAIRSWSLWWYICGIDNYYCYFLAVNSSG